MALLACHGSAMRLTVDGRVTTRPAASVTCRVACAGDGWTTEDANNAAAANHSDLVRSDLMRIKR
jgi:hypothetical protein